MGIEFFIIISPFSLLSASTGVLVSSLFLMLEVYIFFSSFPDRLARDLSILLILSEPALDLIDKLYFSISYVLYFYSDL